MKHTLKGTCIECGEKVQREYTVNTIIGLMMCSDDYRLKMPCSCNKSNMGNVYKKDVPMLKEIREDKLKEILDK